MRGQRGEWIKRSTVRDMAAWRRNAGEAMTQEPIEAVPDAIDEQLVNAIRHNAAAVMLNRALFAYGAEPQDLA